MKTGHYWVLIILVLSLVAGIACAPTTTTTTTTTTYPPPPPPATPAPYIVAGADVQPQGGINFGSQFNVLIMVINMGDGPAQNAHLYFRANPGGLLLVKTDLESSPLAPFGVKVALGDLYPGGQKTVHFQIRAPTQQQLGGLYGINLEIDFSADYYNAQESPVGSITFSVARQGGGIPGIASVVPGQVFGPAILNGFRR